MFQLPTIFQFPPPGMTPYLSDRIDSPVFTIGARCDRSTDPTAGRRSGSVPRLPPESPAKVGPSVWAIPSSTAPLPGPLPFHSLSPNSNALFEPQSRPPSNLSSTVHPHSPHAQPPVLHCLPSTLAEVGSLPAPSTPANVTCPVQPQAPLPVNRFILSNTSQHQNPVIPK
jgi:hypothetical protein